MLERRDAITNEVLEAITFVLAYPTVLYFNMNLDFYLVSGYITPIFVKQRAQLPEKLSF